MKKWMAAIGLMAVLAQPAWAWRPAGWVYQNYPWAYDGTSGDWMWFNPDTQWVARMDSGAWSRLPDSALASGWVFYNWAFALPQDNGVWHWINEPDVQWVVNMRTGEWTRFGHAGGGSYSFVKIADTEAIFELLDMEPTLNDSGRVAFWAQESQNVDGIFTGTGGLLDTVLHVSETGVQDIWGYKSINSNGVVAVQLQYLNNNTTIEVRDGATHTVIVSVSGTNLTDLADPQINDHGVVSFWGEELEVGVGTFQGIYTGNGIGPINTVVDHTAGADFFRFAEYTSINNAGEVAYAAKADGGEYALYKNTGAVRTLVAAPNGSFESVGDAGFLNNNGDVVFNGGGMEGVWNWSGVYSGSGGTITEHIYAKGDDSVAYTFVVLYPNRNDNGDIAFLAQRTGTGNGLYAGPDPVADKVLEVGDTLDGKTVVALSTGRHFLNNQGQMVFHVTLSDGSFAIYRADPD
jgi:hypothetical protein